MAAGGRNERGQAPGPHGPERAGLWKKYARVALDVAIRAAFVTAELLLANQFFYVLWMRGAHRSPDGGLAVWALPALWVLLVGVHWAYSRAARAQRRAAAGAA